MDHRKWTESAALQGFQDDGRLGVAIRIQRFPARAQDWLWLHIFTPRRVYGFVSDGLPGSRDVLRMDSPDVSYGVGSERTPGGGVLRRRGPRGAPQAAVAFVYGMGHQGPDMPQGSGPLKLTVSATFTPSPTASPPPDGLEIPGAVSASIGFGRRSRDLTGFGHWLEQHQETPRFETPYTYLSISGPQASIVARRSPSSVSGYVLKAGSEEEIDRFEISPVGSRRTVKLGTKGGSHFELGVEDVHRYELPIGDSPRASSVVSTSIDGMSLAGPLNDWMPDEFPAELSAPK
ncbi:MAG TPA: hypothetical protein QGF35_01425 [Dehalococcoidia bacterium]|nr:hypothetical protein [Dehalococcoidia bacterium]